MVVAVVLHMILNVFKYQRHKQLLSDQKTVNSLNFMRVLPVPNAPTSFENADK